MNSYTQSFYKILVPVILTFELIALYIMLSLFQPAVTIVTALFIIPPTIYILLKQYGLKFDIPQPLTLIFCGIILEVGLFGLLRVYVGIEASTVGGFIIFLIITYFAIRKNGLSMGPYLTTIYLLIGVSVIQLPVRIYDFIGTLGSLPDYLIHLLGITAGFFLYHREKLIQKINLSVSALLVLFVYLYGYNLWMNKLDYGSFNGNVSIKVPTDIKLKDINNVAINVNKGRLTIMDFWFSRCGACFRTFPEFQKYYDQYKNNPHVQFYTVNQPLKNENATDNFKLLTQRGYTFPMAAAGRDETLAKSLDIHAYPTTVIIDEQGLVIYKGDLRGAIATMKNYLP